MADQRLWQGGSQCNQFSILTFPTLKPEGFAVLLVIVDGRLVSRIRSHAACNIISCLAYSKTIAQIATISSTNSYLKNANPFLYSIVSGADEPIFLLQLHKLILIYTVYSIIYVTYSYNQETSYSNGSDYVPTEQSLFILWQIAGHWQCAEQPCHQ